MPATRAITHVAAQAACAVGPGRHRPHRPTTSSRCGPASTTGHLAHRAGLREPASSRRPLTTRTSRCHDAPAPVAALRCRQHLPCAVAPSAAARPRGSPCSWAAVVEALGCAVLPQAQPTYRRPRLCRRASPSARLSSRRAVLTSRTSRHRPGIQPCAHAPAHMASPARLCRRVSVVEVPALASSSSRVAPPHQRSSRHGRPHIGTPRFSGQTSFLPLGYPSARWP